MSPIVPTTPSGRSRVLVKAAEGNVARRKDIPLMICNSCRSGDCTQPDFHNIPISDPTALAIMPPYYTI
jgi:hypothetical protein